MDQLRRRFSLFMLMLLVTDLSLLASTAVRAQTAPGRADKIDLSTWNCQRFLDASSADVGIMISWLDGYYKHENDPPIIDVGDFSVNSRKLKEFCTGHADMAFVAATDMLFGRE